MDAEQAQVVVDGRGWFRRLADSGHRSGDTPAERRQKTLVTGVSFLKVLFCPAWVSMFLLVSAPLAALMPGLYALSTLGSIGRQARNKDSAQFGTRQTWLIFMLPPAVCLALGGLQASSSVVLWSFVAPILALLFRGPSSSLRWLVAFVVMVVGTFVVEALGLLPVAEMSPAVRSAFTCMNVVGVTVLTYTGVRYYALLLEEERRTQQRLNEELAEKNAQLDAQNQQLAEQQRALKESQQALIQSEKMAALAQLVAGVAHELNTPLGAIRASIDNLLGSLDETLEMLPDVLGAANGDERQQLKLLVMADGNAGAWLSARDERRLKKLLIGELTDAGVQDPPSVAPLLMRCGVTSVPSDNAALLRSPRVEELLRAAGDLISIRRTSTTIRTACDRAAKIVFALKSHAHPGAPGRESTRQAVVETLDNVLLLHESQLRRGVEVVRDYQDEGVLDARHDELAQVWTNLILNAVQAMEYAGQLILEVRREDGDVRVSVIDSGPGIPDDVQARMFDPFFTTKPPGEGTGLGLSISRQILEQHGGRFEVTTRPGRTEIAAVLPVERA